jgi:hypothetical protein
MVDERDGRVADHLRQVGRFHIRLPVDRDGHVIRPPQLFRCVCESGAGIDKDSAHTEAHMLGDDFGTYSARCSLAPPDCRKKGVAPKR